MIFNIIWMLFCGLLVIVGGFLAIWYQAKKVREIHREEIMAERQIDASRDAFSRITELSSVMRDNTPEQVVEWIGQNGKWFLDSRLFLPRNFAQKWLSIGKFCRRLVKLNTKLKQMSDEMRKGGIIEEMRECESSCTKLADEALDEIYRDMNISPIATEEPADDT